MVTAAVPVSWRMHFGCACFVCGTEELWIPQDYAPQSELIADLLSQSVYGECTDVSVPLVEPEVRAWLALAPKRTQSGACRYEPEAEMGVEMLVHALKVYLSLIYIYLCMLFGVLASSGSSDG